MRGQLVTIGQPTPWTTSSFQFSDLLNIFLFRPDINLGATIKDLQQRVGPGNSGGAQPDGRNGQKASFLAGGEFPFPLVQPGQGFTAVTIQFKPFGVKLDFTGTITNDNVIRLHVAPEVSTLDFSNGLTISGFSIPAISTRRAETEIELKDGQSFGIAGLMDHRTQALTEQNTWNRRCSGARTVVQVALDQSQQHRISGAGDPAHRRSGAYCRCPRRK